MLVPDVSDESLLNRIGENDGEALAGLFERYARLVRGIALRILRHQSEADDLLQDVFLFIRRNANRFDGSKCAGRSWIVQMTYHRAIDRRRYLQSRHFYTSLDMNAAAEIPDRHPGRREEHDGFCGLVGQRTMGFLDTLTDDQRNTLSLHFVEGFTFAEIAATLDQSVGNVRNHYYRGLEKLRRQMFPGGLPSRNGSAKK